MTGVGLEQQQLGSHSLNLVLDVFLPAAILLSLIQPWKPGANANIFEVIPLSTPATGWKSTLMFGTASSSAQKCYDVELKKNKNFPS